MHPTKEAPMQYALLIYETPGSYDGLGTPSRRAITAEYLAIRDDPRVVGGAHLQPPSRRPRRCAARRRDARHRRPVRRHEGGLRRLVPVEADDLDAAIEVAARIPAARMGGSVEVRPVVE